MSDPIEQALGQFLGAETEYDSADIAVTLKKGKETVMSLKRKFLKRKVSGSAGPVSPPSLGGLNFPRVATIYSKTDENDADGKLKIGKFPMYVGDFGWGPDTNPSGGVPAGMSVGEYINSLQPAPGYNQVYWHSCLYEENQAEPGGNYWRSSETGYHVAGTRYRQCLEWTVCHVGTTISGALSNSATSIAVANTAPFDLIASNGYQMAIIGGISGQAIEMVKVTARSTSSGAGTLTIERGQQKQTQSYINGVLTTVGGGYPAVSHNNGDAIRPIAWAFGSSNYWFMDVTANCPTANGGFGMQTYNEWRASFLQMKLAEAHFTFFDGVFDDNFIDDPDEIFSQLARVDGSRNNTASPFSDMVWLDGMKDLAAKMRAKIPTMQLSGNTGGDAAIFGEWMNGGMIEGVDCSPSAPNGIGGNTLIGGTWVNTKAYYLSWDPAQGGRAYADSPLFFFNASTGAQSTLSAVQTDYRAMRFGLCFCLLGPGMFVWDEFLMGNESAGLNNGGHQTTWWYDEFDNAGAGVGYLGQPTSLAIEVQSGVWRRNFENGCSLVNFTGSSVMVNLGGTYKRINGTQAPTINNGATGVTSYTLPAYDGIILLVP